MSGTQCKVVVAGDLCIDWLSIPIARGVSDLENPELQNWQLRGGRYMHARHGGAWLTADFIKDAVGDKATVFKPGTPGDLRSVLPEQVIHSLQTLDAFERKPGDDGAKVWAVRAPRGLRRTCRWRTQQTNGHERESRRCGCRRTRRRGQRLSRLRGLPGLALGTLFRQKADHPFQGPPAFVQGQALGSRGRGPASRTNDRDAESG